MPPSSSAPLPSPLSFRQWRQGERLSAALVRAEKDVRTRPADAHARWLLFELLCVMAQWERALQQLQACALLDASLAATAHAMRSLVRAELQRGEVFAGRQLPVPVVDLAAWMRQLAAALACDAAQAPEAADRLREQALDEAENAAGRSNLGAFQWITDSDTRLGPVCELVAAGSYRWVAFADLASIAMEPPRRLLDLVWTACRIVLRDGSALQAYVPTRYPELDGASDALLLARETVWRDTGRAGVFGQGQKTWMTDAGDWPLLDLRHCSFGAASAPPAAA